MKPTDAEPDAAFERLIARGLAGEADASGVACPDADLLAAWFDHSLSSAEADRIEAHASSCSHCLQVLGDLARSEPAVTRAAPLPAPAKPWHWHWRWLVPLATAAVVIVVAQRTLRAPGEQAGGAPIQPGPAQPQSIVAETREAAAPRKSASELADAVRPAEQVARRADSAARQGEFADKAATAPALAQRKEGEAAKPAAAAPTQAAEDVRAEARPVGGVAGQVGGVAGGVPGGVVGGVVGGVAKGRADVQAENIAAAVPAQLRRSPCERPPRRSSSRRRERPQSSFTPRRARGRPGRPPRGATARAASSNDPRMAAGRGSARPAAFRRCLPTAPPPPTSSAGSLARAGSFCARSTAGRGSAFALRHPPISSPCTPGASRSPPSPQSDRTAYDTTDGGRTWRKREPGAALLP